jgi:hypothetical protein
MRAVIQRVSQASVMIAGAIKATMQHGLLVLLAVEESDVAEDIEWLSGKIVRLRIFNDEQGLMNRSVQETGGEILLSLIRKAGSEPCWTMDGLQIRRGEQWKGCDGSFGFAASVVISLGDASCHLPFGYLIH